MVTKGGRLLFAGWLVAGLVLAACPLLAQPTPTPVPVIPAPAPAPPVIDSGHTAWMLTSTALVLLMTPGLALFYGGMVRTKNVLGTMAHSIFAMGLITIQWVLFGYTIAFGADTAGGLFGSLDQHLFLRGVDFDKPRDGVPGIPHAAFMAFQLMFAIITPALITGAFAERVKFSAYSLFILIWATVVYDPLAHWVWGGGILSAGTEADPAWLKRFAGAGALDFAGGTVVHISSGVSALAFILLTGKRKGYPETRVLPNNLVLTVLGAGILWFGWFGFNGGSALASNDLATLAFTVTHIAAASAAFSWAVVEWFHRGKASVLGIASGLVAGLVCITPASGYVSPMSALIMGLIVSPVCYFFVSVLKAKLGYDDSLDAFGVHGIGGSVGAISTGIFCEKRFNAAGADGLIMGETTQLWAQLIATAVTWAFAFVLTCVIVKVLDVTIGVRVKPDDEDAGIDVTQHGEVGYNL